MSANMMVQLWNGKTVPRIGIGTWVMGGAQYWGNQPTGWQGVNDTESLAALLTAFDLGVRIIDTADQYGAGHSEKIIAQGLGQTTFDRDEFVIATKVGMVCDPVTGNITRVTDKEADISAAIDACLKRLGVDYIDLVKFHLNNHPVEQSAGVFAAFGKAYEAGKIAGFGWSNDSVEGAMAYADMPGFVAVQHDLNLFKPADQMLRAVEQRELWAFNRQPLAMGLLTGKYGAGSAPKGVDDIRGSGAEWLEYFDKKGCASSVFLEKIDAVKALLVADGRSLAQGALGWVLAQSPQAIPLPGCRTALQAKDNFGVIEHGPLNKNIVAEINAIMRISAIGSKDHLPWIALAE